MTSASGTRREVGVGPGGLAEDDVRAGPGHPAVVVADDGQRHGPDPAVVVPAVVEGAAQPLPDLVGERRVVEGVRVDVEQPLPLGQQVVEVGEEADPLAAAGARARARPVGAHAADVARHGRAGQAVLARLPVAVGEQEGAGADQPGRLVGVPLHRVGRRAVIQRRRPLGQALRAGPLGRVDDVLDVHAGRVGQQRPDLEGRDGGLGALLAEDPGVRRPARARCRRWRRRRSRGRSWSWGAVFLCGAGRVTGRRRPRCWSGRTRGPPAVMRAARRPSAKVGSPSGRSPATAA